jgi:hypothetical protein
MANRKNFKFKNKEIRTEENPIDIIIPASINMIDSGRKTVAKAAVVNNGNSVIDTVQRAIDEGRITIMTSSSSFNKMNRVITNSDSWLDSDNNSTVLVDNQTAGNITYTLPASPVQSQNVTIYVEDTNTNVVTILGNGSNINGASSIDIVVNKQAVTLEYFTSYGWVITSVA